MLRSGSSGYPQSHYRTWQELVRLCNNWLLVRIHFSCASGLRHRLCQPHGHFLRLWKTKISVSTLPQVGRAVAALLGLPITASSHRDETCISKFANKPVYIDSFTIGQRDMLASALRVTGTKEGDWTISNEPSHEGTPVASKRLTKVSVLGGQR